MANRIKDRNPTQCFFMSRYSPSTEPRLGESQDGFRRDRLLSSNRQWKRRIRPVQLVERDVKKLSASCKLSKVSVMRSALSASLHAFTGARTDACNIFQGKVLGYQRGVWIPRLTKLTLVSSGPLLRGEGKRLRPVWQRRKRITRTGYCSIMTPSKGVAATSLPCATAIRRSG